MTDDDSEIVAPYYPSALRPKLTLGCDRTLFTFTLLGTVCSIYVWVASLGTTRLAIVLCVGIAAMFSYLVRLYRRMGSSDPLLVRVYLRNRVYRAFYQAEAKVNSRPTLPGKSWVR